MSHGPCLGGVPAQGTVPQGMVVGLDTVLQGLHQHIAVVVPVEPASEINKSKHSFSILPEIRQVLSNFKPEVIIQIATSLQ